jgi:hypothetical protein
MNRRLRLLSLKLLVNVPLIIGSNGAWGKPLLPRNTEIMEEKWSEHTLAG